MKRLGAIISKIEPNSIAQELELSVGDEILSVNSIVVNDIMEYSFQTQDEEIELEVKHKNGEIEIIEIEKDWGEDLGISFETAVFDHIKPCCNNCLFCFVDGQPDNLRDSLYVKDDDWRLSYFQGTYITMTNLKEKDWEQIEFRRPSPLFVSVQTTNPELGYNNSVGHRDTSNFKKYKAMAKEEEKHFEEISDEDINRILNEL